MIKININRIKIHWDCFKKGIKNLIHYFKVVWRDRDWDWQFMIDLQRRKLQSMVQYYSENKCFFGQERELRYMKIALYCLEYLERGSEVTKGKHVNDKNFERIRVANGYSPSPVGFWTNFKEKNFDYYFEDVYEEKLWYLYNKIIQTHAKAWWD